MLENFPHILQCLPIKTNTYSSRDNFGGTSPFKVQVNFDIPVFEGQIDAYALKKWLNMLEGYFSADNFSDREMITFSLLKALPCQTLVGKLLREKLHRGFWNIWGQAHLGMFCACGQGTILPCW
jgi:hypothetical protein